MVAAAVVIGGMLLWFAGAGLRAYFTADDLMNLYGYWVKPWREVLVANLAYFSPSYRPMGGLFYRSVFAAFGFDPLPFRAACFVLILVNLGLTYALAHRLAGSREAGLLTALIGCYHGRFEDLYYNTGTVYDLLCFTFYVAALLVYARGRESGRGLRWREIILVVGLYVCALNSKEMAVTLPVAVLIYEWIYHRPELTRPGLSRWILGNARIAWLLAVMAVPYLYGKLSQSSPLTFGSDYQLHISLERYLATYGRYLDWMFYQQAPWFTASRVLLLAAVMLLAAALSRRKALWFGFLFAWLSVLPVIFVTPRGTIFVLYVPFLGWSLYGAALLVWVRDAMAGLMPAPAVMRLRAPVTFAVAALVLFASHRAHTYPTRLDSILRSTKEQLHAMLPRPPANGRILLLDDPFEVDDWSPLFLIRLSYADVMVEVHRVKRMKPPPNLSEIRSYDLVLTYREGRLVRVAPAQAAAGGP